MIGFFLAALLVLMSACHGNTVDIFVPSNEAAGSGSGATKEDGDKRRTSAGARGSAAASAEDESADFPQDIAGSFLTCGRAEGPASAKGNSFGCRVERDSQVVSIDAFSPIWILEGSGYGESGEAPQSQLKPLPAGSAWQVEVILPVGQEQGRRVRVRLDFGGGRRGSLSRSLTEAKPHVALAQAKVFHVGDRAFLLPLLTSCGFQLTGATTTDKVFRMKLTVEGRRTAATISLGRLCGVDYDNNTVTLKSPNGDSMVSGTLKPGGRLFNLSIPALEPGTYQLEVGSGNGSFGFDDFLIGEVIASASEPHAKLKLEPMSP